LWLSTLENGLFYSYPSKPRLWDNPDKIVHIEKRKEKTYVGFNSGAIQIFNGNQLVEESRLPLMPGGFFLRLSFDHNDLPVAITDKGYFIREKGQWRYLSGNDILLSSAGEHLVYGASLIQLNCVFMMVLASRYGKSNSYPSALFPCMSGSRKKCGLAPGMVC
jgi:hypothetical protein